MKSKKLLRFRNLFLLIIAIMLLFSVFKSDVDSETLTNDVEVQPESLLTYYLDIDYDGVDKSEIESNDTVMAKIRSGDIYIEDKIPEGLEFVGFVTTPNGTIGAAKREDGTTSCLGKVVDDTEEDAVEEGTWNNDNSEYYYHGLHYTVADRTVRFAVEDLEAGGVVRVGIITKTPTIDDPNTTEVEIRRDFYNMATSTEGALRTASNTVHAYMGDSNATMYNVLYQYTGTLPENNVPELPSGAEYVEGASVGVASPVNIEGYTFSGWSSEDVTINDGSFTMPAQNVVLVGSFTKINDKYKVTYEIEGDMPDGYVVPLEKQYYEGTKVTLDSLRPGDKFKNYTFLGWETDDVEIKDKDETTKEFVIEDSDITIVGKFELTKYKVEYRFFDTVLPPNSDSYLPVTKYYVPGTTVATSSKTAITNPTGYEFLGWYKEDSFKMPEEDVVIYGEWGQKFGEFEVSIAKDVEDEQIAYRVGDIVDFKITVTNPNDYPLEDVIVKENYTKVKDEIEKTNDTKAIFLEGEGYKKETDDFVIIENMPANGTIDINARYVVTEDDEREGKIAEVTNEVQLMGALDRVNHYTLKDNDYIATADFNVITSYRISAEVEKHEEQRTNETTNTKETLEVAGGKVINDYNNKKADGEYKVFFEYVDEAESSEMKKIKVIPDEGYTVKKITLVSSNKDGSEPQTIVIFGNSEVLDGEITYKVNNDGTVELKPTTDGQTSLFANVGKDKNIIAEFEPKKGKVTVHYMINSLVAGEEPTEHSKTEIKDLVGEPYTTSPIDIDLYKLVDNSNNTTGNYILGEFIEGEYSEGNIDVYYYYDMDDTKAKELSYTVEYYKGDTKVNEDTQTVSKVVALSEGNTLDVDKTNINTTDKYVGFEFDEAATGTIPDTVENGTIIKVIYNQKTYTITASVKNNVGGTAKNQNNENANEIVLAGENNQDKIIMTPDTGYKAVGLVVYTENDDGTQTEEVLDLEEFVNENGVLTIPVGYFENVTANKEVVVEFKKEAKVIVKYEEKGTENEIADSVVIDGIVGDEFVTEIAVVENYRLAKVDTTDGEKSFVTLEDMSMFDAEATNYMEDEPITVIYWYEPIPVGTVTVKYIEIDENDIKEGLTLTSGNEISEEIATAKLGETLDFSRNEFTDESTGRKLISVNGPTSSNDNIVIMSKQDNNYKVTFEENDEGIIEPIEIRFYYEKQFNVTVEVKKHTENIDGADTEVAGGVILDSDVSPFEIVNKGGKNNKEIVIKPDTNYKVKSVKVNGVEISLDGKGSTNNTIKLEKGYFTNISKDINVVVEFEKLPLVVDPDTEVIVQYLDIETRDEISEMTIIQGEPGDEYTTTRRNIANYVDAGSEPKNAEGVMTKKPIVVTYYYKKLPFNFKVEKGISDILINNQSVNITNSKLLMIDVEKNKANSTDIVIKYNIKVTNDAKVVGTANLVEIIPTGFELVDNNSNIWSKDNENIVTKVELQPGESKEFEVVLKWNHKDFGVINNIAKLEQVENSSGFDETDLKDNSDSAEIVLTIKTGIYEFNFIYIAIGVAVLVIIAIRRKVNLK